MGITPKMLLYKAELDDPINVDQQLSNNFAIIDKYIGFYQCTSSTRPAPYEGLKIYEIDTQLLYIYALGVWTLFVDTPPVSSSGGRKAFTKVSTNLTTIANIEVSAGLNATFVSELNRRYWVELSVFITCPNYASTQWYMRWASGGTVTTGGTSINGTRYFNAAMTQRGLSTDNEAYIYAIFEFVPNIAGNVTVGLFGLSGNASHTVSRMGSVNTSKLIVRDVGSSI